VAPAELKAWLRQYRPDALLSRHKFVKSSLDQLGQAIPQNIAFADIFLEDTNGRLAGARQNCVRVGEVAVELLAGQMHQHVQGVPQIPTATFIEGTWFDGRTLPRRIPAGGGTLKSPVAAGNR
jgi:LacI family transcriptional regulator